MEMHLYAPALRQAFGQELDDKTLQGITTTFAHCTFPQGATILAEGSRSGQFHILLHGEVTISRKAANGVERVLATLGPGQFFGELSLIDMAPHMASVRAVENTVTLMLDEHEFHELFSSYSDMAYEIIRQIVRAMRRQDQLAIADLEEKNLALQQAYAELQAAQAGLIEKERLEHDLALAAAVQRSLLPAVLPDIPGHSFAAFQQPARQVGGDFYDVLRIDEEHVALLLADVADKGMHAALIMAVTRTLFRVGARHLILPTAVLQEVHHNLLDIAPQSDTFVTAFYGVLHLPTRTLTYARAAQERPLLARPGCPVQTLPGDGRFLGMLDDLALEERRLVLEAGDRLLLFSDGLPDALDSAGETYGYERLAASLAEHAAQSAPELTASIVADLNRWTAEATPFDDLTLLVIAAG